MNGPIVAVQFLFYIMGGLGLFFTGVGVLWFTSLYKKSLEEKDPSK